MKRFLSFLLVMVFALSAFTACGVPQSDDLMDGINPRSNAGGDIEITDVSDAAVSDFALRLFKESMEDGENTLISPLSVLVALSMTANGADNETLSQMESVLGMPIDQLNTWISTYMANLPEEEKYKLSLANSIWFKDDPTFVVNEDFLQTNADYYGAGIYKAPFDDSTLKEINKWVEDNTDGMIKDILDQIPEDAVMYLVNALAFDAEWQNIYNEYQIQDGKFTTEDGTVRDVELMYSNENKYLNDDKAEGFIKYYANRKYAFAALLPNEGVSVSEYIASLDGEHLHDLLSDAKTTPVDAAIPKFETEYKVEMSEILKKMGMPDAFDGTLADFSKLGSTTDGKNIFINRVIHQTYINVDGKGTKAGAATVVEMTKESAMEPMDPPKQVYLDRPFVYMLIDCETNLPFFIGTMMDVK
ncbi:MAG: serpin family protein [Oscillospiraceae bacterium]|nr:serpin family protein [Oscillospiraceae bacterium]